MVLKGIDFKQGETVLTSALEHNAVMRPLHQLEKSKGIKLKTLPYSAGVVSLDDLDSQLKNGVRLCVLSQASNVTGEILDLAPLAQVLQARKIPLLVDAAQSAGFCDINLQDSGVSFWCSSGHKGLMGSPGVGLLYVAPGFNLEPIISGGTGSQSESLAVPESYPDHLEAGTLPGPAIASLGAAVTWISQIGLGTIRQHKLALTSQFIAWAQKQERIHIYGSASSPRLSVISLSVDGLTPDQVADILDREYGISIRAGLQCAAAAHRTLGTSSTGLIRISFGWFNTEEDVEYLCQSMKEILQ